MKALVFDPSIAGVSGDMVLSALVDLLGLEDQVYRVAEAVKGLEGCRIEVRVTEVRRAGLRAKRVEAEASGHLGGPAKLREALLKVGWKLGLSRRAQELALRILDDLVEAELSVHGSRDLELHELASPDTLLDIAGAVTLLETSGLLDAHIYTTPPALGGGRVNIGHGYVKGPAPATLELLRRHGLKYSQIGVDEELSTPTGVAILANIAEEVDLLPPLKVEGVGYGAGHRELPGIPNVLRVVKGVEAKALADRVAVLETNLDDVPGEVIGFLVDRLMEAGALDVVILQGLGKKGRPQFVVKALAKPEAYEEVLERLVEETGTLGVRVKMEPRVVLPREEVKVDVEVGGVSYEVRFKVSRGLKGELLNIKPEYEDVKRIALRERRPLREVAEEVKRRALSRLRDQQLP